MNQKVSNNNYFSKQKVEKITNSFVTSIKALNIQENAKSKIVFLFFIIITTLQQANSQTGSPTYQFMGGYAGTHADAPGTVPAGLDIAIIPASIDTSQRLSSVTVGDLDNDGDLDFISGSRKGKLIYFQNTGTPTVPHWVLTPLATLDIIHLAPGQLTNEVRPELVDIDNDGDLDLLVGSRYAHAADLAAPGSGDKLSEDVVQYINTGTKTNPIFTYTQLNITGTGTSAHNNLGEFTNLAFVDIDNDDDLDLISQGSDSIAFAENIGTKFSPNFVRKYKASNPFDNTLTGITDNSTLVSQPEFVDLDKDGDLDMYYMQESGAFVWRENKGTATTPNFIGSDPQPMETELDTADIGAFGSIAFGDYNGDGVLDVLASNFNPGYFAWFKGLPQGPTLNTTDASVITSSSATLGGDVTASTGSTVSEKGIVYAITTTNSNPQISGTGVTQDINGTGLGSFSKNFTGLTPDTQYSYAAYAINTNGTTYGTVKTFTTIEITPPAIHSITVKGAPVANATSIDFDITFDEASTNVSTDDFSIDGTGVTGTITAITGSGNNYTITVTSISGTGTLSIDLKASTDIIDAFGNGNNNNGYVSAFTTGATHTVDTEAPAGYTINFDQASINSINKNTIGFTFNNAETGSTFNYTFSSDGGGTNVTGSSTIVTATDQISGIDLSSLNDGDITLSITLTDINNNIGSITTDTTTKDIILPSLTNSTPINNAIDISVDANLELTFNENIKIGTGNITIKKNIDDSTVTTIAITDASQISISNKVLTINLTTNLAINTGFYVEVESNAIKDISDNYFAGILSKTIFNFTTINKTPATIVFNDFEKNYGADIITLLADTNSTGVITYTIVGDAKGASITGDKLTLGNTGDIIVKVTTAATATHSETSKEITITINKVPLAATADDKSRNYGEDNPEFTISYTGFVNDDTEADLDTAPVATSTATNNTPAGAVSIDLSTGTDTNYDIINTNGILIIIADATSNVAIKKKYGFSPNGDGINDTWTIDTIENYPNNTVKVFNRSGKLVYEQKAYKNTWNGVANTIGGNQKLPVGPYLFIIELNNANEKPVQGWLYINY